MTIEQIDGRQEITAKTSPDEASEIDVGDLTSSQGVFYIFEGDHSVDIELLSDPEDVNGIEIDAGYRGAVGPLRGTASGRPRFVQVGSGTETFHVLVVEADEFTQGVDAAAVSKASRQLAGDADDPATVAGGHIHESASQQASGSATTVEGWSALPTVDLDVDGTMETYLDVSQLGYARIRGRATDGSNDADLEAHTRLDDGDDDKSHGTVTASASSAEATDVAALDLNGVTYLRVTTSNNAEVYLGGGA